jgi:hypothetical protein
MSYRREFQAEGRTDEDLANMLAMGNRQDTRRDAAEAELRLREHRAILRQTEAAEQAARAAERGAEAAKEGAAATVKYAAYTFWILIAAVATAAAAIASLFRS